MLASEVTKADSLLARAVGLLGRSSMGPQEGLWIVPCSQIHTFFMAFPIDVVFLDRGQTAARVIENLKPWRMTSWVRGAHSALELAGGTLNGSVQVGDQLEFRSSETV